jgi:hypothetical protein
MKIRILRGVAANLFVFLMFIAGPVVSQHLISPWSVSAGNGSLQVAISMGEIKTGSYAQGNGMLTEGLYQGRRDFTITVRETKSLSLSVFPNPFVHEIHLVTDKKPQTIFLFDIAGRVVFSHSNGSMENEIVISPDVDPGFYIMVIVFDDNSQKSVRVVKL